MSEEPNSQLRLLALSVMMILLMGGLIIWQGSQPPVSSVQKDVLTVNQISQKVIANQAFSLVVPSGDVRVNVPSYSIQTGATVSLVMTDPNLFKDEVELEEWSRPLVAYLQLVDADGRQRVDMISESPLEICFKLNQENWLHYQSAPVDFQIQSYNDSSQPKNWKELNAYQDQPTRSLCSKINHFSLYSLAIRDNSIPITGEEGIYNP